MTYISLVSGWIMKYRRERHPLPAINKCLICGVDTKSCQILICKDVYCRLTFKIVSKKVITNYIDESSKYPNKLMYLTRGSFDNPKYHWYILPDRSEIDAKYQEIISKNFLLNKITEVEFIRLFKSADIFFCNPCQLKFNRINYEKHNSIIVA